MAYLPDTINPVCLTSTPVCRTANASQPTDQHMAADHRHFNPPFIASLLILAIESNLMLIRRLGKGIRSDLVRLPSGQSLREAKVRHFEAGPLHNNLENGFE